MAYALSSFLLIQMVKPFNNVRNIVLTDLGALVVQTEPVGLHVVEPDPVGSADAGLGEYKNRR